MLVDIPLTYILKGGTKMNKSVITIQMQVSKEHDAVSYTFLIVLSQIVSKLFELIWHKLLALFMSVLFGLELK